MNNFTYDKILNTFKIKYKIHIFVHQITFESYESNIFNNVPIYTYKKK